MRHLLPINKNILVLGMKLCLLLIELVHFLRSGVLVLLVLRIKSRNSLTIARVDLCEENFSPDSCIGMFLSENIN